MANEIINLMYSDENPKKTEIVDLIKELAQKTSKGKELVYKSLEYTILSSQIKTHHSYLKNMRAIFKEKDPKNFGYVNKEQFSDILDKIDPTQ